MDRIPARPPLRQRIHVNFIAADCEAIDYERDRYDVVFFNGSLHHISDPPALLDRILS